MYLEPSPVQECNSKAVFVCAAALLGGRSLSSSSRSMHVRNTAKLHRFQHTPAVQRVLTSWIDLTLTFQEAEVGYWFVLSHYLRKGPAAQSAVPTSQITWAVPGALPRILCGWARPQGEGEGCMATIP